MANIVIKSDYIERIIDHDMDEAKNEIHSLKEVVRDSLKNIRKIIYDLLPMSLSDLVLFLQYRDLLMIWKKIQELRQYLKSRIQVIN